MSRSGQQLHQSNLNDSSSNSFIPQIESNNQPSRKSPFIYDRIFHIECGYNPKVHRDDRQHSKFVGLNQAKEEKEKCVPCRSSSEYGRREQKQYISFNDRSYPKIDFIKKDFYRNNGLTQFFSKTQ